MKAEQLWLLSGWALLACLSFFWFPGHSILQSDTQIYVPMMERMADPSVLVNDPMATRPHVGFTLYDDFTLLLHRLTGLGVESVLQGAQFFFRSLGLAGIFLIATGLECSHSQAFVVTVLISLGAAVMGPAVLTVEYEPVPRGFALPFIWLLIGCSVHKRWTAAAACGALAFAFHPPTALAPCALLGVSLLCKRRLKELVILALAPCLLILTMAGQTAETMPLWSRIDPQLEALQRMRAPYNWISIWWRQWIGHYLLLLGIYAVAMNRLRPSMRLFTVGLPVIGVCSLPLSYLLLDVGKWSLIPQFQPGRYLLFLTFFTMLLCAICAVRAPRRWEAALFLLVPLAVPLDNNLLQPTHWGFAVIAAIALAASLRVPRVAIPTALLCFSVPWIAGVRNVPPLHSRDLDQLVIWAHQNTPADAVFQFIEFHRSLEPGVFRARSRRALYNDWKSGGQVNFSHPFALLWQERWSQIEAIHSVVSLQLLPIDYAVLSSQATSAGEPVYRNGSYVVYRLQPSHN